jgi:hypothetical protein
MLMTIEITREPTDIPRWWEQERCCFCFERTPFWYAPKDVAVCEACALTRTVDEVPAKRVWCDAVEAHETAAKIAHVQAQRAAAATARAASSN